MCGRCILSSTPLVVVVVSRKPSYYIQKDKSNVSRNSNVIPNPVPFSYRGDYPEQLGYSGSKENAVIGVLFRFYS